MRSRNIEVLEPVERREPWRQSFHQETTLDFAACIATHRSDF